MSNLLAIVWRKQLHYNEMMMSALYPTNRLSVYSVNSLNKIDIAQIEILCPIGTRCLTVDYCFSKTLSHADSTIIFQLKMLV